MTMTRTILFFSILILLQGCVATKAVTTTAKVATKATVLTVGTTAKAAKGTVDLVTPDGDDKEDEAKKN